MERAAGRNSDLIPPPSKMFVGSVDDFESSGRRLVQRLEALAGLTPDSTVLDIGSGIGRLAVALTGYLGPAGRYEGLEIVPTGVAWCQEHITPRYPNFRFTLADVRNGEYNPDGQVPPTEYRLPYEDETFDLVVLTSVFTHMLPDESERYVDEIARVLKPGGRCFATYSLLNADSRRLMKAGASVTRFPHERGPYAVVDEKVPELAVAYEEQYVREQFARHGLDAGDAVYYGGWSGRPESQRRAGLEQDVVVSVKPRTAQASVRV
jgi:SAM-dependent methyltransferase